MADINDGQDQTQIKYLTHDDLNSALYNQKKDLQKVMENQSKQFQELLQSFNTAFGPKPEAPPVPSKAAIAEDTTVLKNQLKVLLEEREQHQAELKRERLEKNLRDNLVKHGINSKSDIAIKFLQDQVFYDEDGQLVMKTEVTPGVVQPLVLSEAVAKFAQTEHGKFLSDPRDVKGSGSRTITNPNSQAAQTATALITGNSVPGVFKDAKSLRQYASNALDKSIKY